MDYKFYFLNNNRVIGEWRGCFENKEAAERFADGAAIGAMCTTGEIGVYGVSESEQYPIARQMTDRRKNVIFAYAKEKESCNLK